MKSTHWEALVGDSITCDGNVCLATLLNSGTSVKLLV